MVVTELAPKCSNIAINRKHEGLSKAFVFQTTFRQEEVTLQQPREQDFVSSRRIFNIFRQNNSAMVKK